MIEGSGAKNILFLLDVKDSKSVDTQTIIATCTYDDLGVKVLEGSNKGKSVLWWLAKIARDETTSPFETIWHKFKDQITLTDLRIKAEEGEDKGKSVLWLLMTAAMNGRPQAFYAVYEKFKNQITLENLRIRDEEGSLMWLVGLAIRQGDQQIFKVIWDIFQNQITLQDLRAIPQKGFFKGLPLLSLLGSWIAMFNRQRQAIEGIWEKFQNQITLEDLRAKAQEGHFKGISVLWWLIVAAANNRPQPFQAVWEKFQNHIILNDLLVKAEDGPHQGKSVLWWLIMIAVRQNPQPLQAVWKKFQNQITLEDLCFKAQDELSKGISGLWLIVNCAFAKQYLTALDMLREILAQMPFALNEQEFTEKPESKTQPNLSIKELIEQCTDASRKEPILKLIQSRNILFKAINTQQEKALLEEQDIETLSTLANTAMIAGYANAFYDIGLLFYQKNNPQAACVAFQAVPPHAKQFTTAYIQAANTLLGQALNVENTEQERYEHLEAALWFTLRLNHVDEKIALLQKIAYCHVTKGGTDLGTTNFIDPHVLKCLNEKSLPRHCFDLFEIQYKLAKLEAVQQQVPAKKEEQSNPIKPSIACYTPDFNAQSQALPQEVVNESQGSLAKKEPRKRSREY